MPGECMLCRAPVDFAPDDPLICPLCRYRWVRIPPPLCPRCGQPRDFPELPCRICPAWPEGFSGVLSAVWLDRSARRAVHQLKYEGWWRTADALAEVMAPAVCAPAGGTDLDDAVLLPVPLAPKRLRRRGYNQSEVLVRALQKRLGRPAAPPGWLRRVRETSTQTALTPEVRRANIAGAVAAGAVRGRRLILVVDVFTTGATLAEAAAALLDAGAAGVRAVTFARARTTLPQT
ncbi:MAG: ComF family protein [Gemmatimonadales bacterium]